MKYIKTYETLTFTDEQIYKYNIGNEPNYSVGDYVKLKMIPEYVIPYNTISAGHDLFAKIIEINTQIQMEITYKFQFIDKKTIYGFKYLIRRKMTKKEIAEYKIKEEAQKYNL